MNVCSQICFWVTALERVQCLMGGGGAAGCVWEGEGVGGFQQAVKGGWCQLKRLGGWV